MLAALYRLMALAAARNAATHAGVFAAPDPAWQEYGGGRKLFVEASARIVPKTR